MKNWFILLAIYVLIHDPKGDSMVAYTGQTKEQIDSMLGFGPAYEYSDETTYNTFLAEKRALLESAKTVDKTRIDSIKSTLLDSKSTPDAKIDAIINYLGIK